MTAREILDTVWLVGSGTDSDASTDPHDCHCYLVWDGTGGFLVDAGTGRGARQWLDNVAEICDPSQLGGVLVTHYHADHAGGSAAARGAGLSVLASPVTVDALAAADEERTALARARAAGVYPPDYHLTAAVLDRVEAGESVTSAGVSLDVIDASGHCDGHLVFRYRVGEQVILFSGDCLFSGGRVSMQAIPDCRLDRYAETVIELAQDDIDVLLPGHGEMVLASAGDDVRRAAESFRRLVPPLNFL